MAETDHAATAHLDTPKERALRNDYDLAQHECDGLKAELKRVRMIPLSEEAEAMFYWRNRCNQAEEILQRAHLAHLLPQVDTRHGRD